MKTIFTLVLLTPFALYAGDNEQKIDAAPIKSVIVYLTGAQITQQKQVTLSPGRNELHFTGLTSKLIPRSIQFTASGDVSLLAINNKIDFLYGEKKNDLHLKQLNDSLAMMNDLVSTISGQISAYQQENQMLAANQKIGGNNNGTIPADLKTSADFFLQRITEINTEIVKLQRKQTEMQEIVQRLTWQVQDASQRTNPPMAEVIVLVNVNGAAKMVSDIELRYVVSDAGWAPSYDLIAEDAGKPIDLKYRAKVFNNTDVDWKNIKMKLSTSDPMQTADAPVLEKWALNFESDYNTNYGYGQQQYYSNGNADAYGANAPATLSNSNLANTAAAPTSVNSQGYTAGGVVNIKNQLSQKTQQQQQNIQYDQIQVSELSAEFDIKVPYDIPADGKPYIVDVTEYNLNATYQYVCVPKMEKEAFLLARITGWEDLDLVEGPANVYLAGTYVGQSYISTQSVNDTLDISLGRDQQLVVTRTKLKDFNNDKSVGTTRKATYSFETKIKNTQKGAVMVKLLDQVPVSQDAQITVDVNEMSKGVLDPATGIITWNLTLQPGETADIVLTYTIKYPKNKVVHTQQYKKAARARF